MISLNNSNPINQNQFSSPLFKTFDHHSCNISKPLLLKNLYSSIYFYLCGSDLFAKYVSLNLLPEFVGRKSFKYNLHAIFNKKFFRLFINYSLGMAGSLSPILTGVKSPVA
jgi:hypothetical protein